VLLKQWVSFQGRSGEELDNNCKNIDACVSCTKAGRFGGWVQEILKLESSDDFWAEPLDMVTTILALSR
jgi:hypothetical protein